MIRNVDDGEKTDENNNKKFTTSYVKLVLHRGYNRHSSHVKVKV